MNLNKFFSNIVVNEKKVIYLVFFLPIALFVGSAVSNLVIFLIIFIFIYEIFKKKEINFIFNKEFIIFIILYIYLILNSIFLTENLESITRAVGFIRFPILAYAIAFYCSIENNKYQNKILNFWFLLFCIVTIDILFEYTIGFNLTGFKSTYYGRIASFTGDELKIGGYYFAFILLAISFVKYNLKKNIYFILLLFLITSLLIGEKANFIKVFFITSVFLFFIDKHSYLKKIFFIGTFVTIAFIIIQSTVLKSRFYHHIFIDQNTNKLIFINKNIKDLAKSNQHINHYLTAIEIFKDNKIFGAGLKNFRAVSYKKEYNLVEEAIRGGSTHPHQIHFEILSETGLVGYILTFGMLIYFMVKGLNNFVKSKNILNLSAFIFVLATILPIIPSGSFFTSYTATLFWINFSFLLKKKF